MDTLEETQLTATGDVAIVSAELNDVASPNSLRDLALAAVRKQQFIPTRDCDEAPPPKQTREEQRVQIDSFVSDCIENVKNQIAVVVRNLRDYKLALDDGAFTNDVKRNRVQRKFDNFIMHARKKVSSKGTATTLSPSDESAFKMLLCELTLKNVTYKFCASKGEFQRKSSMFNIFSFMDEERLSVDIDYLSRAVFEKMTLNLETIPTTSNVVARYAVNNVRTAFIVNLLASEVKQDRKCNARFELENGNFSITQFFSEYENKAKQLLKEMGYDLPIQLVFSGRGSKNGKEKEEANDYYYTKPDEANKTTTLCRRAVCSEGVFITDGFGVRVCGGGDSNESDSSTSASRGEAVIKANTIRTPSLAQAIVYVRVGFLCK